MLVGALVIMVLVGSVAATWLRHLQLELGGAPESAPVIRAREAAESALHFGRQTLRTGRALGTSIVTDGELQASVDMADLGGDRVSLLARANDSSGTRATTLVEVERLRLVEASDPDGLPMLSETLAASLLADPAVPKTYFFSDQTLTGVDLTGLVVIGDGVTVRFDDVTISGALISEDVLIPGPFGGYLASQAPRATVVSSLRINPAAFLPGVAVLMPDGVLADEAGGVRIQLAGDVVAHEVALVGSGAIHGQVASVMSPAVDAVIDRPGHGRGPVAWAADLVLGVAGTPSLFVHLPRLSTAGQLGAIRDHFAP